MCIFIAAGQLIVRGGIANPQFSTNEPLLGNDSASDVITGLRAAALPSDSTAFQTGPNPMDDDEYVAALAEGVIAVNRQNLRNALTRLNQSVVDLKLAGDVAKALGIEIEQTINPAGGVMLRLMNESGEETILQ
jgi:hypothetical protein